MIRVLVVDDSQVSRDYLIYALESDPQIKVIGHATNGLEALAAVKHMKPDVVTMDIQMPVMDGYEATRRIMESSPVPILIVSSGFDARDNFMSFKAVDEGALAIIKKPGGLGKLLDSKEVKELLKYVKLISEIKVYKRKNGHKQEEAQVKVVNDIKMNENAEIKIVVIGASTGGPKVLEQIFMELPKNLKVPVLVVQHIAPGFIANFVEWMGMKTGFPIHLPSNGDKITPGHVYFAPDNYHMEVGKDKRIVLKENTNKSILCPSVASLFSSTAKNYGGNAMGVLLSGMGEDGAKELKVMRDRGAITVAQNKETSIVFGMPGKAITYKAAKYVLNPQAIAKLIGKLTS